MPTTSARMTTDCYDDKTEITASLIDVARRTVILHIGSNGFRATLHMSVKDTMALADMLKNLVSSHRIDIIQQIAADDAEAEAFIR